MDDRAYSKGQIFWGTMLGGPLAATYFLRSNFLNKMDFERAEKTLIYGLLLFFALVCIIPFLPENIPSAPFGIAYAFGARAFYEQYQSSMRERIRFSNWRVVGISLLMVPPTFIAVAGALFLFDSLGFIDLKTQAD